jgi:glucose-6-phosphate 1-dehydrogenase
MSEAEKESVKCVYCDALVLFGATGNLAYKKNFPSLQLW